jgi:hypothetical protein
VRGDHVRAEPLGHQGRDLEGPHLEAELQADREAEPQHRAGLTPGSRGPRAPGAVLQAKGAHEGEEGDGHEALGEGGGRAGTFDSPGIEAQVSEDQGPVRRHVEAVGEEHDPQRGAHDAAPLQPAAQHGEGQVEGDSRDLRDGVAAGQATQVAGDAEATQDLLGEGPGHGQGDRQDEGQDEPALQRPPHAGSVSRAVRLADQGVQTQQHSLRDDQGAEDPDPREGGARQRLLRVVAEHQHVDDAQHHRRHLGGDDRCRQLANDSQFDPQGHRRALRARGWFPGAEAASVRREIPARGSIGSSCERRGGGSNSRYRPRSGAVRSHQ